MNLLLFLIAFLYNSANPLAFDPEMFGSHLPCYIVLVSIRKSVWNSFFSIKINKHPKLTLKKCYDYKKKHTLFSFKKMHGCELLYPYVFDAVHFPKWLKFTLHISSVEGTLSKPQLMELLCGWRFASLYAKKNIN